MYCVGNTIHRTILHDRMHLTILALVHRRNGRLLGRTRRGRLCQMCALVRSRRSFTLFMEIVVNVCAVVARPRHPLIRLALHIVTIAFTDRLTIAVSAHVCWLEKSIRLLTDMRLPVRTRAVAIRAHMFVAHSRRRCPRANTLPARPRPLPCT